MLIYSNSERYSLNRSHGYRLITASRLVPVLAMLISVGPGGCTPDSPVAEDEQAPGVSYADPLPEDGGSEEPRPSAEPDASIAGKSEPVQQDDAEPSDTASGSVNREQAQSADQRPAPRGPGGPRLPPGSTSGGISANDFRQAAFKGEIQLVQKGLAHGVDINAADEDGNTAVMLAAFNGHDEIVRLLLKHDADVNAKNSVSRTALMFAATAPDNTESVKALLEAGAKVNAVDGGEGYTALMFAAGEGHSAVAKQLLVAGADPSIKDIDDETAAIHAANSGHTELARLLSKAAKE